MALVPIISQTWDTTSVFNPTRMNNIENNIAIVSKATGVEYSSGVSVKDKIEELNDKVGVVNIKTISNSSNTINFTVLDSSDTKQFFTLQGFDSNVTPVNCTIQFNFVNGSASNGASSDGRTITTSGNVVSVPVTAWSRFMVISPYAFNLS